MLPQQRSAGGEHLHQSHPRPPGAGGAEKGGNGGDPGGLGRRLPPDGAEVAYWSNFVTDIQGHISRALLRKQIVSPNEVVKTV